MLNGTSRHSGSPRPFAPRQLPRWITGLVRMAVVAFAVLCVSRGAAAADMKVAIIDLRRAMFDTEDGLRVQSKLKQLVESRQQELDDKQKALQQAKVDLDKDAKAGKISKAELQKKYETLQQQAIDFEKMAQDYQRDMQRQDSEMTAPIAQRLMALVRRMAAQNGYDLVLDKAAAPYFRSDLDITDRVIQLYNAAEGLPADQKGKEPAAAPTTPPKRPAPKAAPARKK
jgi:outer membrane protein